jgi:hypothetical protein
MRNVIILYVVPFIFLPVLRAGTAPYHNPINNSLIKAIIKVESSGNPKAISREGAWGLMQVRHVIWEKELKRAGVIRHKQKLLNPEKNILAGEYILTKYYGQTGCLEKTLRKYSGNKKNYYEKVMIVFWRQTDIDCWLSFYRHKSFDWEPGRLGIIIKWQADITDDCRIDVLEEYRAGTRQRIKDIIRRNAEAQPTAFKRL